jgi:hypothetical protein
MDHRRSAAICDYSRIVGRNQDVARTQHGGLAVAGGELERPAEGKHICWCGALRQLNEERGDDSWNRHHLAQAMASRAGVRPAPPDHSKPESFSIRSSQGARNTIVKRHRGRRAKRNSQTRGGR